MSDIVTPENLHNWYLEAVKGLNPTSYNPNAQKSYNELTDEQQSIDRYISDIVNEAHAEACRDKDAEIERLKRKIRTAEETSAMRAKEEMKWRNEAERLRDAEAEIERLRDVVDKGAKAWLSLDPGIPWEGCLGACRQRCTNACSTKWTDGRASNE